MFDQEIKAYAEQRRIPYLVHFTRLENLRSILHWGVLSRNYMGIHDIKAVVNDVERHDGRANASCLSISFPNHKMLFRYRERLPEAQWAILLLDRAVLWEHDCAFCCINAASKSIAQADTDTLRGVDAFRGMFQPTVGNQSRSDEPISSFDPTDAQAEVLAFEPIDTCFIRGIRLETREECERAMTGIHARYQEIMSWDRSLFLPRWETRLQITENKSMTQKKATRPVFVAAPDDDALVRIESLDFPWHSGLAPSQKQKSVRELHDVACQTLGLSKDKILEVSQRSEFSLGTGLSAFNLSFCTKKLGHTYHVESAYQASKVFENGGPFRDILAMAGRDAKKDQRLKTSGNLLHFEFFGDRWELHPTGAFYAWIYLNALRQHPQLTEALKPYSAFTDIEFNPKTTFSSQALAVALFVSLAARGEVDAALASKESFLSIMRRVPSPYTGKQDKMQIGFPL